MEVNGRVNYPIKLALNEMNDADDIDLEDTLQQFAVSEVTKQVASHGCKIMVSSWNNHVIPGKNAMENNDKIVFLVMQEKEFRTPWLRSQEEQDLFYFLQYQQLKKLLQVLKKKGEL